jgi:3-hydroxy-9,10-secoandrosta-1,3,5(10)-triene-9,17-dione monooxygenase
MFISKYNGTTHEDVMANVRALLPVLRSRIFEAEQLRRQPDETIKEIIDAKLIRMLIPRRWGGDELSFETFIASALEVSRINGSLGWCYAFFVVHAYFLALFPEQAQRDVWEENLDALIATSFVPSGQLTVTEGGYILKGKWQWLSGIDHSSWAMLNAHSESQEAQPTMQFCLVPRRDFEVVDSWFVTGARGTGSNSIIVEEAFVPVHRVISFYDLIMGQTPGSQLHTNPMYQLPLNAALPSTLATAILGATQGAYETWIQGIRDKYTTYARKKVTDQSHVQIRVAEIAVQLDSAHLLLQRALETMHDELPLSREVLGRMERDYAYIARLSVQAIEQLYLMSGASANYESNPLQSYWRDIHAMASHATLNFDTHGEAFGKMVLSLL